MRPLVVHPTLQRVVQPMRQLATQLATQQEQQQEQQPTTGTTTGAGGTTTVGSVNGAIPGVWFGNNNFGDGVMVIDANENIYALTRNTAGRQETVFGPASGQLDRFIHRDSENAMFAQSFTLVGDPPSTLTEVPGADSPGPDVITYALSVENDGQSISNSGGVGDFQMTFATNDDVPAVSLADVAGDWSATTSFQPVDGNITVRMNITETGVVTGSTQFNNGGLSPLSGNAAAAAGSDQYLSLSFTWLNQRRTGVLYRDRADTTRLIVNTVGPNPDDDTETQSFTASMIR